MCATVLLRLEQTGKASKCIVEVRLLLEKFYLWRNHIDFPQAMIFKCVLWIMRELFFFAFSVQQCFEIRQMKVMTDMFEYILLINAI